MAAFDIKDWVSPEFYLRSRVHELNRTFPYSRLFIKREDELSSGIPGAKYRKYASLIPFFRKEKFDEILLIGSAQSNNIVGALQLLNENQINARLMLLESNEADLKGNMLWISMLHNHEKIIWIQRNNWPEVNNLAKQYRLEKEKSGLRVFIVYEGAAVAPAIPGAMTLASDILDNEKDLNLDFDHICIDSGSGTSSIGLLLGLQYLNVRKKVHITLIAGNESEFHAQFENLAKGVNQYAGVKLNHKIEYSAIFHRPSIAPSFGSIPSVVMKAVKTIAREEGVLMDPVYSVKHLLTVFDLIKKRQLSGNILSVYNGGSLGLSGFQKKLADLTGQD